MKHNIIKSALNYRKKLSNHLKSFTIQIEAVDNSGKRITDDYVYANDLAAGQNQDFDIFTYVSDDLIDSMKSATYKIVTVSEV